MNRHARLAMGTLRIALVLVLGTLSCSTAMATDREWIGGMNGLWSTGANWSPNGTPASSDNLFVYDGTASYAVTTYWTNAGGSMTINGSAAPAEVTLLFYVCGDTSRGDLRVLNGGKLRVDNSLYFGYDSGSEGWAQVAGAGAELSGGGVVMVGYKGRGSLAVNSGGTVSLDSSIIVGGSDDGQGEVVVDGDASQLLVHDNDMWVGALGTGALTVTGGGRVIHEATTPGSAAVLGYYGGGAGTATVRGAGSEWTTLCEMSVGNEGTGTLDVSDGGRVSATAVYVAKQSGSVGTVTVDGAGSRLDTGWFTLNVGFAGNGTLTVSDGGAVTNQFGIIGHVSTSTSSSATVTGAGSTWTNNEYLYVGYDGAGTLTVSDGGTVSAVGHVRIGEYGPGNGTVNLQGGTLRASDVVKGTGTAAFHWTGGTLELTGAGGLTLSPGGLLGATVNVVAGKALRVTNATTVDPGVTLGVTGGSFSTESLYVYGTAQLRSGPVHIDNNVLVDTSGRLEIAGQDMMLGGGAYVNGNLTLDDTRLSAPAIIIGAGGSVDLDSGTLVATTSYVNNEGVVRMGSTGGAVIRAPSINNYGSGAIMGHGSIQAAVVNQNIIALDGNSNFTGDVTNQAGSKLYVTGDSRATFFEEFDNGGAGAYFYVEEGCRAIIFGQYTAGTGNEGPGNVYAYGDLRPGASPGLATFGGDLYLGPLAGLEIELGGLVRGDQYDAVVVDDKLTLNGTLDVVLYGRFSPVADNTFDILDWGTRSGTFDDLLLPDLPGNLIWDVGDLYTTGEISVAAAVPGDANKDGKVNEEDATILATNWGQSGDWTRGNFNGDGLINAADASILAANWGYGTSESGTVPEPGVIMLLLGLGASAFVRRGRWWCR